MPKNDDIFYPVLKDLKVNQQYIFYSTLKGATKNKKAKQTGERAVNYLNNKSLFNPLENNDEPLIVQNALDMLKRSCELEEKKERNFINFLIKEMPDNPILKKSNIDFMDLIVELNRQLKGNERAKFYIELERKRWKGYQKNYQKIEREKRKFRIDRRQGKHYHELRGAHVKKSIMREIGIQETSYFSNLNRSSKAITTVVSEIVANSFGDKLFVYKNNLKLDTYRVTQLINVISKRVYEYMLLHGTAAGWSKKTASDRANAVRDAIKNVYGDDDYSRQATIDSIMKTSITNPNLNLLKQQLTDSGQKRYAKKMSENEKRITAVTNKLKKYYMQQKESNGKFKTKEFKSWMNKNNFDPVEIAEDMALIESIHVDVWYESENKSKEEQVTRGLNAIMNGNKHNLKSDIESGKLNITISADVNKMNNQMKKKIKSYEENLFSLQKSYAQRMRVGADEKTYTANYKQFVAMRKQQLDLLNQLEQDLIANDIEIRDILSYFNIHTSVKDQTGNLYLEKGSGFTGGSVGKGDSAISFIDNLRKLCKQAGYNLTTNDVIWLKTATLNVGMGLIGSKNKRTLENYFTMFANFLMFDDAQNIVADAFNNYEKTLDGTVNVQDIHLYAINGIYIPLSYMLRSIYESLKDFTKSLSTYGQRFRHGATRAQLSGYDVNYNPNPGNTYGKWHSEAQKAVRSTKIKVVLMSGFLDLLDQLEKKIKDPI